MRKIGSLPDRAQGDVLGNYLVSQGIANQIDPSSDGSFAVWVLSDEKIEEGTSILSQFQEDPDNPVFNAGAVAGRKKIEADSAKDARFRKNYHDRSRVFKGTRIGLVTAAFIGISVIVTIGTNFGDDKPLANQLYITAVDYSTGWIHYDPTLPEVRAGQIWRLLTPVFLHFNFIHLLFNMLWVSDLGTVIERRHGSLALLLFAVLIAVPSNLLQFLATGPTFGGMSGVVYGLLGYLWIRGKVDPFYEIHLRRETVLMMGIWFVLCIVITRLPNTPLHVANVAHAVGLAVGMVGGVVAGLLGKRKRYGK